MNNDCCKNFVRTSEETKDGLYSMSYHSPNCENYKTNKYIKLSMGGNETLIQTFDEFKKSINEIEQDESYNISIIELTEDQFNNLPEFNGF